MRPRPVEAVRVSRRLSEEPEVVVGPADCLLRNVPGRITGAGEDERGRDRALEADPGVLRPGGRADVVAASGHVVANRSVEATALLHRSFVLDANRVRRDELPGIGVRCLLDRAHAVAAVAAVTVPEGGKAGEVPRVDGKH